MRYSVLVVAAGKRAGEGVSYKRALANFKDQGSVLAQSVSIFLEDENCTQIVVVASAADMKAVVGFSDSGKISYVKGGKTRTDSMILALTAVLEDVVIVHDGVRPWVRNEHITCLLGRMASEDACVLGITQRGFVYKNEDGYLGERIETSDLIVTQTPQAYKTSLLIESYHKAKKSGLLINDDASIVQMMSGVKIAIEKGDIYNVRFLLKESTEN